MSRSPRTTSVIVLAAAFAYAILRYNIIKGVSWEHLPLLISNKAISLASVGLIALSYALGSLARFWPALFVPTLSARKYLGLFGFGLGALHGLMSLLLFSPATYPRFFLADGSLSLTGELAMLFGILALFIFSAVAYASIPVVAKTMEKAAWLRVQQLGYLGLVLIFFHVLSMGLAGWPGGLLPISMVAAIILALALLLKIIATAFPSKE